MLFKPNISNNTLIPGKKRFLSSLRKILGYRPSGKVIYEEAFIHRSATYKMPDGSSINNERLEFLGDAILDAVISEYLYKYYPGSAEGKLTKLRSRLANRNTLNNMAMAMGIDKLLISNVGNRLSSTNIFGDALEALIGAVFIDKGYRKTREFIIRNIFNGNTEITSVINTETDYKSQIFEWGQKLQKQISFNYTEDYDFNEKKYLFATVLRIDHEVYGEGTGSSKKEAEQKASLQAVKKINKTGFIR
ncbi:MAG: ribonuclease III [Bacteroidales bacterium]